MLQSSPCRLSDYRLWTHPESTVITCPSHCVLVTVTYLRLAEQNHHATSIDSKNDYCKKFTSNSEYSKVALDGGNACLLCSTTSACSG